MIIERLTSQVAEWLQQNGPCGWIDDLRKQVMALSAPVSDAEWEHLHEWQVIH